MRKGTEPLAVGKFDAKASLWKFKLIHYRALLAWAVVIQEELAENGTL